MPILFHAENIDFPPINKTIISNWIRKVAKKHDKKAGSINYIFCSEKKILDINLQYLNHDYYTDIITFDYSENNTVSGDIYISLDTVKSNALSFSEDYRIELHRVIIHGVLHLCGIEDKKDRAIMEKSENEALSILPNKAYKHEI
jgi:rRNA maturation RNase YbeY